jgi:Ca2+-binding EF-hand superfamily protein
MKHWSQPIALLSIAAALAMAGQPAFAQGQMAQQIQDRFAAADKDHDGKLTKSEAKAGMPRVAQYFEQIDADNTGAVSVAQIGAFMAKQKR